MSPIIILPIFVVMKEEIYKKSYENFMVHIHEESSSILPKEGYSPELYYGATAKHPLFMRKDYSKREEDFKNNLTNLMCGVIKNYVLLVVEKTEDKVSIKLFEGIQSRQEGRAWFKFEKYVDYISVNTKTGDVYHGYIRNYQKKRGASKNVRRNSFFMDPVNTMKTKVKNAFSRFIDNSSQEVTEAFSHFITQIDDVTQFESLNHGERLLRFYLNKRNIKYPNNFHIYTNELVGPEIKKIIKKNDHKLVDSVMKKHGLNGKKTKRALHLCTRLNISLYKQARQLFGDDWLNQDNENVVLGLIESPVPSQTFPDSFVELVSKDELKRVYGLFKQVYLYNNIDVYTFIDHIRMYTELKMYGENDLKWMSDENKNDFGREHLDWSDKLQHYKGGSYERHYPEYMYEEISKPIFSDYHPILLDKSSNYNEESNHQSNCVKGYIGKPSCLIISVRTGNDLSERATLEYRLTINNETINAERIQSLGKFNQKLDEQWTPVLLKLDEQVLSCVRDERYTPVKLTKKCNNGVILNSDTYWNDQGLLRWKAPNIDNENTRFNPLFDF